MKLDGTKLVREWGSYGKASAELVKKSIKFAGHTFQPDEHKIYVVTEVCHSLPLVNSKRRGFTAATLANSYASFVHQLADIEHRLEYYGATEDKICGAVAAAEFPDKEEAMRLAEKGEAVPVKILAAIWRKVSGVSKMAKEIASGDGDWMTSMECIYRYSEAALWDGEKFYPWNELSDEQQSLVTAATVKPLDGKEMSFVMGGEEGSVRFGGFGFTRNPADRKAEITDITAAAANQRPVIYLNGGWENAEDWRQSVASAEAPKDEKAAVVIGRTAPAEDGHTHEITRNLEVLASNGHGHYFRPIDYDPETGALEGITSTHGMRSGENYMEHAHQCVLGIKSPNTDVGGGSRQTPDWPRPKEGDVKDHIKWLRETAAAADKANPELAKSLREQADRLEKDESAKDATKSAQDSEKKAEEIVASRITSGDLIPKAKHLEFGASERKAGYEQHAKEVSDAAALEKKKGETVAARVEKIKAAKLDPKGVISGTKTLADEAASFPADEAGEKAYAEKLEERIEISKKTGLWKAVDATASGASAGGKGKEAPHGGDVPPNANGNGEKPRWAFL